ncbi:UNVERIFIED_CONTAM: hypothetical protein Sradi_5098000 [Sesamum radiatum]|uniref:Reverse transcriptase Ty1/copia-type domain-containing protein n=1 Tax=Sesamum radiatum TaxID=300843 RepID=A0AAW2M4K8_SESRA
MHSPTPRVNLSICGYFVVILKPRSISVGGSQDQGLVMDGSGNKNGEQAMPVAVREKRQRIRSSKRYLSGGTQYSWKRVLLEKSSEPPQQNDATSFGPSVPTNGALVLRRSTRESRPPERYVFVGLTSQLDNDTRTYGEAMLDIHSDKWLETMKSKMDSDGFKSIKAFKARLVANGYAQRPGVDFQETYSSVAMTKSIWKLLPIAAWYNNEIWQMNVKTIFLNCYVEEEIYINQPEGFISIGE